MPREDVYKEDIPAGSIILESFHFTSYQDPELIWKSQCSILEIFKCSFFLAMETSLICVVKFTFK